MSALQQPNFRSLQYCFPPQNSLGKESLLTLLDFFAVLMCRVIPKWLWLHLGFTFVLSTLYVPFQTNESSSSWEACLLFRVFRSVCLLCQEALLWFRQRWSSWDLSMQALSTSIKKCTDHSMQTYLENCFFLRQQWRKLKQKYLAIKKCTLFFNLPRQWGSHVSKNSLLQGLLMKRSCKMYTDGFWNTL